MPQNRTTAGRFVSGQSGNPGGRPRGFARATRDLLGDDGLSIARFWLETMLDESEPTRVRLEASRLLAERGWGRAPAEEPVAEDADDSWLRDLAAIDREIERLSNELRRETGGQRS
jgi:Family of unknown function (DUF5681)